MKDTLEQTLRNMLDADGHFWIGSTSQGRAMIDKAPHLAEVLELAIEMLEMKRHIIAEHPRQA